MTGERPVASVVIPVGRVDGELDEQLTALGALRAVAGLEIVLACNVAGSLVRHQLDLLVAHHHRWPIRVIDASARTGAAYARNIGAEAAAGPVLLFCDADDRVAPDWAAALLAAHGPGRAVGGHLDETELAIEGQSDWRPPATPDALPSFLGHPYLVSANCCVDRDDFLRVRGFDEGLTRCEDLAFSYALVDDGVELVYAPDAVVHYRHRAGLVAMVRQHFAYGRGMSEIVARGLLPGAAGGMRSSLRPNGQPVDRWTVPQLLRKGALGTGRVVGAAHESFRRRRASVRTPQMTR